jgi:hypothetical protein
MGFLDGALRIMPAWELSVAGHPLVLSVLVPALLVPGAFFTLLAAYPLLDRRLTGGQGLHHVLDRPRDAATRTAVGAAGAGQAGKPCRGGLLESAAGRVVGIVTGFRETPEPDPVACNARVWPWLGW